MSSRTTLRRCAALALAGMLWSAHGQAAEGLRVGSKIDTEGSLLGNLILQTLEAHGIKTVNRLQLGNTKVIREAITSGEVDIYPEYTGNGAFFFSDVKESGVEKRQGRSTSGSRRWISRRTASSG